MTILNLGCVKCHTTQGVSRATPAGGDWTEVAVQSHPNQVLASCDFFLKKAAKGLIFS
jgi:hypothetical protein